VNSLGKKKNGDANETLCALKADLSIILSSKASYCRGLDTSLVFAGVTVPILHQYYCRNAGTKSSMRKDSYLGLVLLAQVVTSLDVYCTSKPRTDPIQSMHNGVECIGRCKRQEQSRNNPLRRRSVPADIAS